MMRMKKPITVSIIAWILTITSGISLVASFAGDELPPLQYYVRPVLILISGVAILKKKHWGRVLYVLAFLVGTLIVILNFPVTGAGAGREMFAAIAPGVAVFFVFAYLLFREKAKPYFKKPSGEATGAVPVEKTATARIACEQCGSETARFRCTRCNRKFGDSCIRTFGEKAARILMERVYGRADLTFGSAKIFDDQGRAFCPRCYGDLLDRAQKTGQWSVRDPEEADPSVVRLQRDN